MHNYHSIVEKLLYARLVKVACLKDDEDTIVGYALMSNDETTLDWVFVKRAWRTIGIAKSLVSSKTTTVTHLTKSGLSISKKKHLQFNPFAL
jgi:GNAT superfamily N-acetyltransferase